MLLLWSQARALCAPTCEETAFRPFIIPAVSSGYPVRVEGEGERDENLLPSCARYHAFLHILHEDLIERGDQLTFISF